MSIHASFRFTRTALFVAAALFAVGEAAVSH
ncbi:hypothetical protein EVA_00746, partial [gut metagenome]